VKRCVLSATLNWLTLVHWCTVRGSWFHALGAAQEKDRSPILVREVGYELTDQKSVDCVLGNREREVLINMEAQVCKIMEAFEGEK